MAAPTKAELIESLEKQGVKLTGEETVADLKVLIEANAEILTNPEEVAQAQSDADAVETSGKKGEHTRTIFHLNNIVTRTREFSEEVHGEAWQEIAEEFAKNNAKKIRSREDL